MSGLYGSLRMTVQLIAVGYLLNEFFNYESPLLILAAMAGMLIASGFIVLRNVPAKEKRIYLLLKILLAHGVIGFGILFFICYFVIGLDPFWNSRYLVPLAGMMLASCMNACSLALERYYSELSKSGNIMQAESIALKGAMIPITNTLLAVGLVSLPGMMTGQILSGVSPIIAVRYQIVVMAMLYANSGLTVLLILKLIKGNDTVFFNK